LWHGQIDAELASGGRTCHYFFVLPLHDPMSLWHNGPKAAADKWVVLMDVAAPRSFIVVVPRFAREHHDQAAIRPSDETESGRVIANKMTFAL